MCENTVLSLKNTVFGMLVYEPLLCYTCNVAPCPGYPGFCWGAPTWVAQDGIQDIGPQPKFCRTVNFEAPMPHGLEGTPFW